jgi:hypothetical protein
LRLFLSSSRASSLFLARPLHVPCNFVMGKAPHGRLQ